MTSFILTKHYNLPMVASLMLTVWGVETLLSDHWVIGALMTIIGFVAYFALDCQPHAPEPSPVPTLPKPIDPALLPIEWEAAFDEPTVTPASFSRMTAPRRAQP